MSMERHTATRVAGRANPGVEQSVGDASLATTLCRYASALLLVLATTCFVGCGGSHPRLRHLAHEASARLNCPRNQIIVSPTGSGGGVRTYLVRACGYEANLSCSGNDTSNCQGWPAVQQGYAPAPQQGYAPGVVYVR